MKILRTKDNNSNDQDQQLEPCSLHEIIMAQCDEPNQRHYIYRLDHPLFAENFFQNEDMSMQTDEVTQSVEKYYQIRVKRINFLN